MLLVGAVVVAYGLLFGFLPADGLARPIVGIVAVGVVGVLTVPSARRVSKAHMMSESAVELARLGRTDEEIKVYDDLAARFGESREGSLRAEAAQALFNKGHELDRLGRDDEAVAAFDEVTRRFGADRDADVANVVLRTRVNRAATLTRLNRHDDALAGFQGVVRDTGEPRSLPAREAIARARAGVALSLLRAGRHKEAVLAANDGIRRCEPATQPAVELQMVAMSLIKAEALAGLGSIDEELATYDEIIDRHGETVDPEMSSVVAHTLLARGEALLRADRIEESCAADDEAFEWISSRIVDPPDTELVAAAARAMARKGLALFERGRLAESLTAYDRGLARMGDPPDPALLIGRSSVLNNKGASLAKLEHWDEARSAYEEALAIRQAAGETSSNAVALMRVNLAEALASTGRGDDALALCDQLTALLAGRDEPEARLVLDETKRICGLCRPTVKRKG
jgi:tetratricopeptide (TPR) repeat protein